MNRNELTMLQALPLEVKIMKTKQRIREAIEYFGVNGVYVPVSGGKDSQVLSHIVEQVQIEDGIEKQLIPRVNSNTGNEYPEVLVKARELSDIEVRPLKSLYKVLTEEGYPIGSKKISRQLRDLQNPTEDNFNSRRLYWDGIKRDGTITKSFKLSQKWRKFVDSPYKASEKCCHILKKEPMLRYEKQSGRHPLIGTMADEGGTREQGYLQTGCNAFKNGKSMPIGFWTEQDILKYIIENKLEIASVYGEIIEVDGVLKTTGESRTGCFCCLYGVQMESKTNNRFTRMKITHPKAYNFCINGGVVNENGRFVPKMGLGMGKILDEMNILY